MSTVRVVSWHPASQGPFVILDARQFDPAVHELYVEPGQESEEAPAPADVDQDSTPVRSRGKRGLR